MKRALETVKAVFVWLIVGLAVGMMIFTVISVTSVDKNDRNLFGYRAFIVRSDSMKATDFGAGDVIFVKEVDPAELREGDIVAYISQNRYSYGETVTHKIRRVLTQAEGGPGFITYGTSTGADDETVVTYPYVLGKYTGKIPKIGRFFLFLKTPAGYVVCILVPFLLLIGYNAVRIIRHLRGVKKEERDELQAQKDKLAQERREIESMMEDLLALKAQLAETQPPPTQEAERELPAPEPAVQEDEPPAQELSSDEQIIAQELPVEEEEPPAEEEITSEELPMEDELSSEAEIPAEEEVSVEEVPAEKEVSVEEIPAEEDVPVEEVPAEEEQTAPMDMQSILRKLISG